MKQFCTYACPRPSLRGQGAPRTVRTGRGTRYPGLLGHLDPLPRAWFCRSSGDHRVPGRAVQPGQSHSPTSRGGHRRGLDAGQSFFVKKVDTSFRRQGRWPQRQSAVWDGPLRNTGVHTPFPTALQDSLRSCCLHRPSWASDPGFMPWLPLLRLRVSGSPSPVCGEAAPSIPRPPDSAAGCATCPLCLGCFSGPVPPWRARPGTGRAEASD